MPHRGVEVSILKFVLIPGSENLGTAMFLSYVLHQYMCTIILTSHLSKHWRLLFQLLSHKKLQLSL